MVERTWTSKGGEVFGVSTSEMVHMAHGMLYRSKLFRTKSWTHQTYLFNLCYWRHFRCSRNIGSTYNIHRCY